MLRRGDCLRIAERLTGPRHADRYFCFFIRSTMEVANASPRRTKNLPLPR